MLRGGERMPRLVLRIPGGPALLHRSGVDRIVIGRDEQCDVALADEKLSRQHAELRHDGRGWLLTDLGSRNGTMLNGRRVEGALRLRTGDELLLGGTVLVVDAGDDPSMISRDTVPGTADGPVSGSPSAALVGRSEAMSLVRERVLRLAPSDATLLVTGESGTGKELVARLVHASSRRAGGPFVVVNCPALPPTLVDAELFGVERGVATGVEARPGRLEMAAGGTLFLDEVADLDLAAQARLLRFLQEKKIERVGGRQLIPVDARVVAATHRDLEKAVEAGTFRADLLHRLAAGRIRLPPLRERREDIPDLVAHFLARPGGPSLPMGAAAMALLQLHDFAGNVRALENAVEVARHVATGPEIEPGDLPETVAGPAPSPMAAAAILERIVSGKETFWDAVQEPFLRRELPRDEARSLVAAAKREGGGTYKGAARLLGVERQYKKFVNFINWHDLGES
jgi:two-component system response regulator AtoC